MFDASSLSYYKTLCEQGVIDEQKNNLDDVKKELQEKYFNCLEKLEIVDDSEKEELKKLLNTIDLQLKEIAKIKALAKSGSIIEDKDDPAFENDSIDSTVVEEPQQVNKKELSKNKKPLVPIVIALIVIVFLLVAVPKLLHGGNSGDENAVVENSDTSTSNEQTDTDSDTNNNTSNTEENGDFSSAEVFKDGQYAINCGMLREKLAERFTAINPEMVDLTDFDESVWLQYGVAGGEAITVKTLATNGPRDYSDTIKCFVLYAKPEDDVTQYLGSAINLADSSVSIEKATQDIANHYETLKTTNNINADGSTNFQILTYDNIQVWYTCTDAQVCAIIAPGMDIGQMWRDYVEN